MVIVLLRISDADTDWRGRLRTLSPDPFVIRLIAVVADDPRLRAAAPPGAIVNVAAPVVVMSVVKPPGNVITPLVETLSPPLEINSNVPVVLPMVTLLVPVPNDTAPAPLRVNVPEPWEYPVTPERAPPLMISPLMVLSVVGAVIGFNVWNAPVESK